MQLGITGLGRMGGNIARRLMRAGHSLAVHDTDPAPRAALAKDGARDCATLEALVKALEPPRAVWVMLPSGKITQGAIDALAALLSPGDTIIDGGNAFWKDDIARAKALKAKGLHYLDIGTSGGVWGLERGYCLMIGGEKLVFERLEPLFKALAPGRGDIPRNPGAGGLSAGAEEGYLHCGPNGSGHFVKMIHNGIEYGMMQAMAEGFDILKATSSESVPEEFRLNLNSAEIAEVWRRGSVVTSWLLDLTAEAL